MEFYYITLISLMENTGELSFLLKLTNLSLNTLTGIANSIDKLNEIKIAKYCLLKLFVINFS